METLRQYVERVMKEKGLNATDVQRNSSGEISDVYVSDIVKGDAKNPGILKLKALAQGLGVDFPEVARVAAGIPPLPDAGPIFEGCQELLAISSQLTKADDIQFVAAGLRSLKKFCQIRIDLQKGTGGGPNGELNDEDSGPKKDDGGGLVMDDRLLPRLTASR